MRLAWWPQVADPRVASFRLRCLRVVGALRASGHDAFVYQPGKAPPDVLTLSKRYDPATLLHALELARTSGTKIVLDLCDNHFHFEGDAEGALASRARYLRDAVASVDMITASSQALADIIRQECPQSPAVSIVDDAAEQPSHLRWWQRWTDSISYASLQQLNLWHQRNANVALARRFVWFGNHGSLGVEGGMSDLRHLRAILEESFRQAGPLSLTVVSNKREKYEQITAEWKVPTFYLDWHANNFSQVLQTHSAALIPVTTNSFTVCKTANRVLTAFQHGLNVIADAIPSYAEFKTCAVLDDWEFGLNGYSAMAEQRRKDVAEGQRIAHERYSLERVTAQWLDAARAATALRTRP